MDKSTSLVVRKRIATLFFLFTLVFFLLLLRIFWVQFVKGAELAEKAMQNRMRDIPVEAKRGIIYDRNGHELAISVSVDSIYAIPAEVKSSHREREIADKLARVLAMDEEKVYNRITSNTSFVWIKRQVDPETTKKLREMDLPGIGFTEESRRFYPKGSLASHVLGISGIDNTGLEGIDYYYNDLVGGTKGRIIIEHDAANRPIPEATHKYIPPQDGANLILTIDETIQYIVERELDKVFKERKAKAAAVIVMDPHTGEILAMASRPTFDPNNYNDYPSSNRRNFAINDVYEPGSTMKIITAAMALEEGVVSPQRKFFCPGYVKVGRETIGCSNRKAHGSQTFAEVVANSCNVGFVEVGLEIGLDRYYKYINNFGFGKPTGIDLPGEAKGILVPRERAMQIDLATMSIGQANAVTPLQLITAVSAVANGGNLMQPHLVKSIIDKDGKVIKKVEPKVVRKVISPETARELCLILEGVVQNGTGKNAYIEGYKVAGKTGTAQKISPTGGYLPNEYVASFIGFAPADNPRLSCIVVVDAPQGYPYYGGWVAAPVFREIMKDALRYLEVPLYKAEEDNNARIEKVVVPDIVNLPLGEAIGIITSRGLNAKVIGTGNVVWKQAPKAQTKVDKGTQIIVYLSSLPADKGEGEITVPDLEGKSMREVAKILSDLGLHLMPEGYGLAYEQSPEPGKIVTAGSTIKVKFQPVGE
ncbi:stage V sporulation protein D (sporulation-specific penicillin-binding protein) [Thermosyntropha lipolytica DSM 11003]|uniref:Stage V sporulation protein D (Sporulation-specific penicillin-binding protein) n=1 Tax=Thermosyntropha lipolytica DSM 11003 TaxID=1123382 RepID=A0A1M5NYS2_9FIRM|nr:stage V sporulation protein D [Thermosyntropha lipolytica]SHG94617.1 stage V sporulation protein D (sporulation-specific penicillin-binding protein) [Thermosyntropha lipolytica DSM 11003]